MRKLILLSALFFVMINISFAQLSGQARIDSLLKELPKAKQDTNHVNLLANLSFEYYSIDPNSGIKFGEQGVKLAQKIAWKEGLANCYNSLGANYDEKSDYSNAIEYYNKSLKINEELGNKKGVASALSNIGIIYKNQSDYPNALEYYQKAIKIYEEIRNKRRVASILRSIGDVYYDQSNYPQALEYYHKSISIDEELGDKKGMAVNLGNMGNVYFEQSDFPKALEYINKALKIFEELGDKKGMAVNLGNMGNVYFEQSDFPKALEYINKALKIYEDIGNKSGIGSNLGNMANVYASQSNYLKALEYYSKAIKIYEEIRNKRSVAINLGNMGNLYLILSQDSVSINPSELNEFLSLNKDIHLKKSIEYLLESIEIFEEIGELHGRSTFLLSLTDAYSEKGDYQKAFEAFKEHKTLQDSVFSMDKEKEIANLEAKRENELKDKEIVILQTEKKAQQFQSYLLGGGVIVLLGAFGLAFLRFREKKKLSDKLAFQKSEIETQKSIVEEKNEQITASITYASTIQHAILPWASTLKKSFGEILVFYKPKDIVSGDSYWFKEVDGVKYLAAIDCTGHGIPGAMLTVIASSVLDDAILGKKLSDTAAILTYMNDKVTDALNQRLTENKARDGMEVALIAIHKEKVQFSGAGRPLYLKNGELEIVKTDKRGIAGSTKDDDYQFNSIEIEKSEGKILYLTTDGFADQMNDDRNKYSTKRFIALLENVSEKPIPEQHELLETEFNNHRGNHEQIDDVTILGVKL